jgi:hypothetical protein
LIADNGFHEYYDPRTGEGPDVALAIDRLNRP